jgi:hypothetical protein
MHNYLAYTGRFCARKQGHGITEARPKGPGSQIFGFIKSKQTLGPTIANDTLR